MKKQYIIYILSCIFYLSISSPISVLADDFTSASLLGCTENNQILYEQNIHQSFSFTGLYSLLVALVAEDHVPFDKQVAVPAQATLLPSSAPRIYLEPGEQIYVQDCLAAILLAEAEDAANTLAIHIAGSKKRFIEMLNEKAASLGADHTRIICDEDSTLPVLNTTPADLYLIAKAFWQIPHLRSILLTPQYEIAPTNQMPASRFYNRTHPLTQPTDPFYDDHCLGGFHGHSLQGSEYILSFTEKEDLPFIAITISSESVFDIASDHTLLLAYGYQNFSANIYPLKNMLISKLPVYQSGNKLGYVDIFAAHDLLYVTNNLDSATNLQTQLLLPSSLSYSSYTQAPLGYIQYYEKDRLIAAIPCIAFSDPSIQNIAFLQSASVILHAAVLSYAPPPAFSFEKALCFFLLFLLLLVSYFFHRKHTLF